MTVCIVGHKGNMGRRYASILNYLNVPWFGVEKEDNLDYCDTFIVATPTSTHIPIILRILETVNSDATILCEKPITTDITEFDRIPKACWDEIYMVNQYAYVSDMVKVSLPEGITYYNFYHSGQEGIAWDCIQLIHLANEKSKIVLNNRSPIWKVQINGWPIGKEEIDHSYVGMLKDFLGSRKKSWNLHKAYEAHKDVMNYLEANK